MVLRTLLAASLALSLAAASGCGRRKGPEEGRGPFPSDGASSSTGSVGFDSERPLETLSLDAGEAARRIGSFEWTAGVEWSVSREGSVDRIRAIERHRLVQAATGEFHVESEIDPGLGEGSQTGREVIWAQNMTYARGRWAPWRERPTDHGRDAARFRGESFGLGADLAARFGPRLATVATGETRLFGRTAWRYTFALAAEVPEAAPLAETRLFPQGGPDPDTKRRLAFLEGAQPVSAKGELVVDEQTGLPLRLALDAAFAVKADPRARVQIALRAQVKALGVGVPAVAPPKDPLLDERKPRGVADALERAGLKKKPEGEKAGEPGEEADQ